MKKLFAALLLVAGFASADTSTTNLGLTKPTQSSPNWGTKVNNNYDIIDASVAVLSGNNTFTGNNVFSGGISFATITFSTVAFSRVLIATPTYSGSDVLAFNGSGRTNNTFYTCNSNWASCLSVANSGINVPNGSSINLNDSLGNSGATLANPYGVGVDYLTITSANGVGINTANSNFYGLSVDGGVTTSSITATSSATLRTLNIASLAGQPCLGTDSSGNVQGGVCGGGSGSSSLAVISSGVIISSPTSVINIDTMTLVATLFGSTTSQLKVNPSLTISTLTLTGFPANVPTYVDVSGNLNARAIRLDQDVSNVLPVVNGGTGQSVYSDGQILLGNTVTGSLSTATFVAGSNITLAVGSSSITISASGSGGGSATLPFPPGATNYVQVSDILQSGATFYVSSGTVARLTVGTPSPITDGIFVQNGGATIIGSIGQTVQTPSFERLIRWYSYPSTSTVIGYTGMRPFSIGAPTVRGNAFVFNNAAQANVAEVDLTTAAVTVLSTGSFRMMDADNSNYVGFKASNTVASHVLWTLPAADGTSGQVLTTNGNKTLYFSTGSVGSSPSTGTLTIQDSDGTYWQMTVSTNGSVVTSTTATNGSFILVDNLGNHTATQMLTAGFGLTVSSMTVSSNTYLAQGATFYANNGGLFVSKFVTPTIGTGSGSMAVNVGTLQLTAQTQMLGLNSFGFFDSGTNQISFRSTTTADHSQLYRLMKTTGTVNQVLATSAVDTNGIASLFWKDDNSNSGYAVQPATVSFNLAQGATISSVTVSSNSYLSNGTTVYANNGGIGIDGYLNVSSGVVFTQTYKAAVCQSGTASLGFSAFSSSMPTTSCIISTSSVMGVASFVEQSTTSVQDHFLLPDDWTGGVNAKVVWKSSLTVNSAVWQMRLGCAANNESPIITWNAFTAVTDTAVSNANSLNTASINGLSTAGCSAGEEMFFELLRNAGDISDTLIATADLVSLQIMIRRRLNL